MRLAGSLMVETSRTIVSKARRIAAALLEVSESDVTFDDGLFSAPNTNRRLNLFDIARAIADRPDLPDDLRAPLGAEATFTGRIPAYPTGAAVCEVAIDPDTGVIEILRYSSIDDGGQAINPLILHGQVHGGIVQGLGQALLEDVAYGDAGQVLSGSFMDYALPRARNVPSFAIELAEDPTKGNPLRVKGGGEAGITPALAVTMNAIMDALKDHGIEHFDMPATPGRVWSAIQAAKGGHS
jgi:carbon-monoxide dehydrogenase large subunit